MDKKQMAIVVYGPHCKDWNKGRGFHINEESYVLCDDCQEVFAVGGFSYPGDKYRWDLSYVDPNDKQGI